MQFLLESLTELITQTATNLPPDVREAMSQALGTELPHTQASQALNIIASNIDMAAEEEGPICQDTGMPTFVVHTPVGVNQIVVKKAIREAVAEATKRGKLRPNSVDSLTGKNSGNNLGEETPVIHFEQWPPRKKAGQCARPHWRRKNRYYRAASSARRCRARSGDRNCRSAFASI